MKRLITAVLLFASIFASGQTYLQVGNTLQRAISGSDTTFRFNLGSPGFWYPPLNRQILHKTGDETSSGVKTFLSPLIIGRVEVSGTDALTFDKLNFKSTTTGYTATFNLNRSADIIYNLPVTGGTFALTSEIPSNFLTTNTTQSLLTGTKTWSGDYKIQIVDGSNTIEMRPTAFTIFNSTNQSQLVPTGLSINNPTGSTGGMNLRARRQTNPPNNINIGWLQNKTYTLADSADMVDKASAQTINGAKTYSTISSWSTGSGNYSFVQPTSIGVSNSGNTISTVLNPGSISLNNNGGKTLTLSPQLLSTNFTAKIQAKNHTLADSAVTVNLTGNQTINDNKNFVHSDIAISAERTTISTNTMDVPITLMRTSSGDMADGFGTGVSFRIKDNAGTANNIGSIGAVRSGADNSGSLVFITSNSGTASEKMRVTNAGNAIVSGTTTSGVAQMGTHTDGVSARFGHSSLIGSSTYGFLQAPSGENFIAGAVNYFQSTTNLFGGVGDMISGFFQPGSGTPSTAKRVFQLYYGGTSGVTYSSVFRFYMNNTGSPGYKTSTNLILRSLDDSGAGESGDLFTFTGGGNFTAAGTITPGSDVRLKKDIIYLDSQLNKIMQLKPANYNFKSDGSNHDGLIAQEIEEIYPELVVTGTSGDKMKSVDYNGLTAPIIKAVQELKHLNDSLKSENEVLHDEVEELKTKLEDLTGLVNQHISTH